MEFNSGFKGLMNYKLQ